ncbi:helix-turn-helix domain-containing protein [Pseudomonas sp. SC11]|uniref:helix-turn-helix domain-containing protein n=1 Tax=Pseudomonas sp. SC11 TaxID=326927 RepID=UPI000737323C|nr:XRE family transcriptional regulator [Pseudomonas psychrotolerans]
MELKRAFGTTLKRVRVAKGMTQEDFAMVSSRTYLSSLERGLKCPTIEKLDQLANVLGVHPVTLLLASYAERDQQEATASLLEIIKSELAAF